MARARRRQWDGELATGRRAAARGGRQGRPGTVQRTREEEIGRRGVDPPGAHTITVALEGAHLRLCSHIPADCARIVRCGEDAGAVGRKSRDVDLGGGGGVREEHAGAHACGNGRTACECTPKIRINACERRSNMCVLPPASPATSMRPSPRNDAHRTGSLNRVSV